MTMTATASAARIDAFRTTGSSPTGVQDVTVALPPVDLERGGRLTGGRLACRLVGDGDAPVVAVLGGISAGRDVVRASAADAAGWWEPLVGPGRAVDTQRFRVLGIDWIGGRGASTPASGLPLHADGTPQLTPTDQARALACALDVLGIGRLHACVGSSYGGMVALALGASSPERLDRLVVLGAAHEPHPMATALRVLQRDIVQLGIAQGGAREALVLARGLAMTTYRSAREFAGRFPASSSAAAPDAPRFDVADYLRERGERFADAFTPEAFLCLSQSIDLHCIDPGEVHAPITLVAFEPDAIAPAWQLRALAAQLGGPWTLRVIRSIFGHDAFLKEPAAVGGIVADALCRPEVL